jgi:hypothetical protein
MFLGAYTIVEVQGNKLVVHRISSRLRCRSQSRAAIFQQDLDLLHHCSKDAATKELLHDCRNGTDYLMSSQDV